MVFNADQDLRILSLTANFLNFEKVSKFQWLDLRPVIAGSNLEDSSQVFNEIRKVSIHLYYVFDERNIVDPGNSKAKVIGITSFSTLYIVLDNIKMWKGFAYIR